MITTAHQNDVLQPEGYHLQLKSLLLASFAISLLSLALPVMTLQVYDRILPNPGSGTLPILISGVCIAVVLEAALRLSRSYVMGWAGATYEHRMGCQAMNHILQSDLPRLAPISIGEHLQRMAAITKVKDFYNGYAWVTLSELIFVPLFLWLIAYIAGPLVVVPVAMLLIFIAVSLLQGQTLKDTLGDRDKIDDKRYDFLIESLEGIHTIKSFALENGFSRRYEALEDNSTVANFRVSEITSSIFNSGTVFSHLMLTAVIATGAVFALQGHLTTGGLIATILLSGRIMQPVQRSLALWAKYQDYSLARDKVKSIFATPLYVPPGANEDNQNREGSLQIRNLSFRYDDDQPWLLENINLDIAPRDCVLLNAQHSNSKTSLLRILSGIYPPTSGEVVVDGADIRNYTPEKLTHHVGYIQTEGLIFRGTIRDNLTCFGQIDEANVREIAAMLKIDRDVAKLPSGFDSFLSGNAIDGISPGLKQRIAMVRVLATKPRIILFDDADRSLDHEGYNLIYKLLAQLKGKATLILVSQDKNIRSLAERQLELSGTRLSEAGKNETDNKFQPYRELRI